MVRITIIHGQKAIHELQLSRSNEIEMLPLARDIGIKSGRGNLPAD